MNESVVPGWSKLPLSELIERKFTGPSPTCEERPIATSDEWGLLKTTAVTWSGWNEDAHKVPPSMYWGNESIEVKPGDVLITKAGPRHRVGVVVYVAATRPHLMVSGKMVGLLPKASKVLPSLLARLLSTQDAQDYLNSRTTGMAESQTNFADEALLQTQLNVPPMPEQRRIAEVLDTLDDQIRATEKVVAKLGITRNGLMTDLFTCGIEPNGRLRDPIANTDDFKTSGAGSIPKSWRADSVAELISSGYLADIQDGNHGELHPKRNDFVSEGIPFLMARDIAGGTIDFDHCYRIRREQYARLRVGFSKPGDVLLSHKGTVGEVAMVPEDAQEVMLTPQVTYYRPARGLSSEFLFYYMQSGQFQRALRMIAGQSTRDYVGISTQRRLLYIPVPDTSEQYRIVSVARAVDNRIKNEKLQLSTLRLAKVGLSSDLLTGRVRMPAEAPIS
jgi:type I restriction enzyme, S subunit